MLICFYKLCRLSGRDIYICILSYLLVLVRNFLNVFMIYKCINIGYYIYVLIMVLEVVELMYDFY